MKLDNLIPFLRGGSRRIGGGGGWEEVQGKGEIVFNVLNSEVSGSVAIILLHHVHEGREKWSDSQIPLVT